MMSHTEVSHTDSTIVKSIGRHAMMKQQRGTPLKVGD
jgi:hypothetical protein